MAQIRPDDFKIGKVESIDDPNYAGRIKVRIPGLHDNIPTEQLPWCTFAGSTVSSGGGGGSISIPRVGAQIRVSFKDDDTNSMEWGANKTIDKELSKEIASDYAGTHVLLYDSEESLSIMFQPNSGLRLYYQGSNIQITPDNVITIHYGDPTSGVNMQFRDGQIDIQAPTAINISSKSTVNVEAKNVKVMGSESVQIQGNKPGECAVNGYALMTTLRSLALAIDAKTPASPGQAEMQVLGNEHALLNSRIQYV